MTGNDDLDATGASVAVLEGVRDIPCQVKDSWELAIGAFGPVQ